MNHDRDLGMRIEIAEEPFTTLEAYARVPIAFEVRRVLDAAAAEGGLGGLVLTERDADPPYVKDYDADGEGPLSWPARFDLARWGLLVARMEGERVGGAAVAFDTPGVEMLEGRRDLAVLWDLRVAPEARGRGVGAALFRAAEAWAAARGCRRLKVETQTVNVPACRFYARRGCALGAIHRFAYPGLPREAQLLWYRELA
ncbi:MAG TPA: GNAT family N-acetyltransferase [Longimicrobium sp.]|nr:GNAT family N-acetyltransferase [Longimicrobium sp.]